jgi:hypothetical protein
VLGVVHALKPFNDSASALERKSALLSVSVEDAFLDRRMPIANAAKSADVFPQRVMRHRRGHGHTGLERESPACGYQQSPGRENRGYAHGSMPPLELLLRDG